MRELEGEAFVIFMKCLEYVDLPTRDGLNLINDFPMTDEMRALPDMMKEWDHWIAAARESAALNAITEGTTTMQAVAEDAVEAVFAKYFFSNESVGRPRFNLCIAMMKFSTHQIHHAFGRVHGLPYPNKDGSHTYGEPRYALEEAMTGRSSLSRDVETKMRAFSVAVAGRVGFDLEAVLK